MANTTKEGSLLAYNDENNNFKPLPFTAARNTIATVVNRQGLIETVKSGIPRIDFSDDANGALLLEPTSTNLIQYSEAFSNAYWTKSGSSAQGDPSTAGAELSSGFTTIGTGFVDDGGGQYTGTNASGSLTENITLANNSTYKVDLTISGFSTGNIRASVDGGTNFSPLVFANGVYSFYIYNNGSVNQLLFAPNNFSGVISSISLKEVQGFVSPSGTTSAFKLVESASTGLHKLQKTGINVSAGAVSCYYFVKKAERSKVLIELGGGGGGYATFDLDLGTVIVESNVTAKIELISNGWYRCSVSYVTSATSIYTGAYLTNDSGAQSYTGDGTSGVYIFGAQFEEQSYGTSYIKNEGTANGITRNADTCDEAGTASTFNDSEGVLYYEGNPPVADVNSKEIQINSGSLANSVRIQFRVNGNIRFYVWQSGQVLLIQANNIDYSSGLKVAVVYKSGESKLYVNGGQIGTTSTASFNFSNPLSDLTFSGYSAGTFYGSVKDVRVYTTALSDEELTTLTTI